MNFTKILTFAIITMFLLVPFASAKQEVADNVKQDKINEKVTDKTKESAKEITKKDKDIKGKVTVTDSDSSKYKVEKKSKTEIRIAKDEVKGEHTKSKVTFAKEDLQKIDVDGDQLYGVLHIADDGSTSHDVYTESQLVAGTEMVFSENIVNGYSGYYEKTQTGVTSGTVIDIPDVSGSDYYISAAVNGSIPQSSYINPSNISAYPSGIDGLLLMNNATNSITGSTATNTNVTFSSGKGIFTGQYANLLSPTNTAYNYNNSFSISMWVYRYANERNGFISRNPSGKQNFLIDTNAGPYTTKFQIYDGTHTISVSESSVTIGEWVHYTAVRNNTIGKIYLYKNGAGSSVSDTTKGYTINGTSYTAIGKYSTYYSNSKIDDVSIYNRALSSNEVSKLYSHYNGISFVPVGGVNFTSYDVASSIEKIIDTDATCTGLRYIDTTGGTHTVTVRIYFTEDITKTTETKGAVYQNVSIIHAKQNATVSVGSIVYELDPLYSGTPVLTSNNTNATISRNDTHAIISTGLVKQGQSFSYAVSVPDNHDHVIFWNQLMQWVGSGWDYVGVAPEDWTNAIRDIEVTVS